MVIPANRCRSRLWIRNRWWFFFLFTTPELSFAVRELRYTYTKNVHCSLLYRVRILWMYVCLGEAFHPSGYCYLCVYLLCAVRACRISCTRNARLSLSFRFSLPLVPLRRFYFLSSSSFSCLFYLSWEKFIFFLLLLLALGKITSSTWEFIVFILKFVYWWKFFEWIFLWSWKNCDVFFVVIASSFVPFTSHIVYIQCSKQSLTKLKKKNRQWKILNLLLDFLEWKKLIVDFFLKRKMKNRSKSKSMKFNLKLSSLLHTSKKFITFCYYRTKLAKNKEKFLSGYKNW